MAQEVDGIDVRVRSLAPERLGMLLGVARRRDGVPLVEIARRLEWSYGPTALSLIEDGSHVVASGDVPPLVRAYGVDLDVLFPDRDRLVVNLRRGRLVAGKHKAKIGKDLSVDQVLSEYVSFVWSSRDLPPHGRVEPRSLRIDDVVELACALAIEPAEIERRLQMLLESRRERHLRGDDAQRGDRAAAPSRTGWRERRRKQRLRPEPDW